MCKSILAFAVRTKPDVKTATHTVKHHVSFQADKNFRTKMHKWELRSESQQIRIQTSTVYTHLKTSTAAAQYKQY